MKNKKHIIGSGCSFTGNNKIGFNQNSSIEEFTWFDWLDKLLSHSDYEFYNYGNPTNDNKTICRSIFYKVNDLVFENGVNPKDIIVIIQWSTLSRVSWFLSPSKYSHLKIDTSKPLPHSCDFIESDSIYSNGYFHLSGGFNSTEQVIDQHAFSYADYISTYEERYIDWFDSVVGLFSWLEKIGIDKIYCFNMNNNFSKTALEGRTPPNDIWGEGDVYDQMVIQKRVANTWNDDIIIYDNPYVKTYADRIDFDKYFWFFEEENVHKYGGIIEWSIRNFDENQKSDLPVVLWREFNGMNEEEQRDYLNNSWYGHTSSLLTRKFVNEVILMENWVDK